MPPPVRTPQAGSDQRRMGDFYSACMNTAAIDARGYTPLQPDFDRIAAIKTGADLMTVLAGFQKVGRPFGAVNGAVVGPFRLTAGQDPKNPNRVIARVVERDGAGRNGSSIFSLPDRDYYLRDDDKSKQIRAAFLDHAAKLLQLAGTSPAEAAAQATAVLDFEKALAPSVMTIAEKRDPDKVYHPMDLAALKALAPNVDWTLLLGETGVPESTIVNVSEPEFLKQVNRQLSEVPLETWKIWLHWRDLQLAAPYLAKPLSDEAFHFQGAVLSGLEKAPARWETCGDYVDRDISDALGKAYTAKYFPPQAKQRMRALVENLRSALRDQLQQSAWMQPETKKLAIAKLNALQVQIGYPDAWHDYSAMKIDPNDFFGNVRAAWTWGDHYELSKIGKPVRHVDWAMTAPTINAYSNASEVKVVFPAGILQPPFFDMDADDAANYGAIGAVIGHEIGHQFDDGGSKFDATGALKNWWTGEDRTRFDARTACVVDQFDSYRCRRRPAPQRQAGARRGARRSRRTHRGLARLPPLARRKTRTRHRRFHRRSAILHRLRARLGHEDARRSHAPAVEHQRAPPRAVARHRHTPQHARIPERLPVHVRATPWCAHPNSSASSGECIACWRARLGNVRRFGAATKPFRAATARER